MREAWKKFYSNISGKILHYYIFTDIKKIQQAYCSNLLTQMFKEKMFFVDFSIEKITEKPYGMILCTYKCRSLICKFIHPTCNLVLF